ncbi:hypothetical protein ACJMK2_018034 [Sinanodonta woodiana]|uniref:Uncharacterized protein n=1 Tax=Sinanodonta woodiana TaxID=1069815 RepID=A0ABD3UC71_SINWO
MGPRDKDISEGPEPQTITYSWSLCGRVTQVLWDPGAKTSVRDQNPQTITYSWSPFVWKGHIGPMGPRGKDTSEGPEPPNHHILMESVCVEGSHRSYRTQGQRHQ